MNARARRALAGRLRELACSYRFASVVTWLVNAVHDLAVGYADAAELASSGPGGTAWRVQDALLDVCRHEVGGDHVMAGRLLDHLMAGERPREAVHALADELDQEADAMEAMPEVAVRPSERLDLTGHVLAAEDLAVTAPTGSVLVQCGPDGEPYSGSPTVVVPDGGLGERWARGPARGLSYLVARHGDAGALAALAGAR